MIAAARSAGCASSELTCELIDPGGGDGGSSMIVAWPVAWASWLELGAVVFLGGMVKGETVSGR